MSMAKPIAKYCCPVKLKMWSKPSVARIVYRQAPLVNITIKR